ncbi:MAG: imidazoleglycerol-phosphate dehydratase HisB [Desulfarculales bacterium]|jgi:imidazoleglycerol-phosphate dehydratase|nr:imidazoleglycerol-phosphate dehydratase HisB [Desulfarculales bacterium]
MSDKQAAAPRRLASISRATRETRVDLVLNLDGTGLAEIDSGIGFFDHMLTQLAFHGFFDLQIKAAGDLAVDLHHTVEDVGICLGQAFSQALGGRRDIVRYGQALAPMDESLARVALDFSGRPLCLTRGRIPAAVAGGFSGQLAVEFWRGLANNAGLTLHIEFLYGDNDHHLLEAAFKALARALAAAAARHGKEREHASTKGIL